MPTARELLEQADALMRRNRKRGRDKGEGPPTLTDVLADRNAALAPTLILPDAARSDVDPIRLANADAADPLSLDTLSDLPVLTDVVDVWPSSDAPPASVPDAVASPLGLDEALEADALGSTAVALVDGQAVARTQVRDATHAGRGKTDAADADLADSDGAGAHHSAGAIPNAAGADAREGSGIVADPDATSTVVGDGHEPSTVVTAADKTSTVVGDADVPSTVVGDAHETSTLVAHADEESTVVPDENRAVVALASSRGAEPHAKCGPGVVAMIGLGFVASRVDRPVLLPLAWLAAAACGLASGLGGFGPSGLTWLAIGGATVGAAAQAISVARANEMQRGTGLESTAIGFMTGCGRVGQACALGVSGLVIGATGVETMVFVLAGMAACGAALLALVVVRPAPAGDPAMNVEPGATV